MKQITDNSLRDRSIERIGQTIYMCSRILFSLLFQDISLVFIVFCPAHQNFEVIKVICIYFYNHKKWKCIEMRTIFNLKKEKNDNKKK